MYLSRIIITTLLFISTQICFSQRKDSLNLYYGETIYNHSFISSAIHGYAMAGIYNNDSIIIFTSSNGMYGHQYDRWFPFYKRNLLSFKLVKEEDQNSEVSENFKSNITKEFWDVTSYNDNRNKMTVSVSNHLNQKLFYDLLLITEKDTISFTYIYGDFSIRLKNKLKSIVVYPLISSCNFDSAVTFNNIGENNHFTFTIYDSPTFFPPRHILFYKKSNNLFLILNGIDLMYLIDRKIWELEVLNIKPFLNQERVIINKTTKKIYETYFKNIGNCNSD